MNDNLKLITKHEMIHVSERSICEKCGAKFSNSGALKRHRILTHSDERPFKCLQCDAAFKRLGHLAEHMGIHTGERPFKCLHCDFAFKRLSHLTEHMRIHTGERPYKCLLCDASFTKINRLKSHMTIPH